SIAGGGQLFFRINQASGGATAYRINADSYTPPTDGTWVHVAATYDGQTMRLYIDGALNNSRTLSSPTPIGSNGLPLAIGAQHDGASKFRGAIDDVRIYSAALGGADIAGLAETPPPPPAPALLSPANLASGIAAPPELSWQPAEGAASYRVQVSETSD